MNEVIKDKVAKKDYLIFQGDALEILDYFIENEYKFDAIITDIPYGVTAAVDKEILIKEKRYYLSGNQKKRGESHE